MKMDYNTGELIGYGEEEETREEKFYTMCYVCEEDHVETFHGVVVGGDVEDGTFYEDVEWEASKLEACPTCGQWWDELETDFTSPYQPPRKKILQ